MPFSSYNYHHFSRELLEGLQQAAFAGPEPGERAPNFKGVTLDGKTLRLSDFQGKKNVLLVFGSATCPMTAASIGGINRLHRQFGGEPIEFLFIYVREAHPGEQIPAHQSADDKVRAAMLLRAEEDIAMPMLVDDLRGSIHRKYSRLPNPVFLIDKSGSVAFRSMWAKPAGVESAIEELLELQRERDADHAVVNGGQDLRMPLSYSALSSFRALERGGDESVSDFRQAVGLRARGLHSGDKAHASVAMEATHDAEQAGKAEAEALTKSARHSLLGNTGRILAVGALTAAVVSGGLYAGFELRRRRLGTRRNPYRAYEKEQVSDTETGTDYGAVGI
ncbi:MAG: peroxiredoxin family protein [Terriglobales bacterium]